MFHNNYMYPQAALPLYWQPQMTNMMRYPSMPVLSLVYPPPPMLLPPMMNPGLMYPPAGTSMYCPPAQQSSLVFSDSGVDMNCTDPSLDMEMTLNISVSSNPDTEPRGDKVSNQDLSSSPLNTAFDGGRSDEDVVDMCSRGNCELCEERDLLEILHLNGCPRDISENRRYSI